MTRQTSAAQRKIRTYPTGAADPALYVALADALAAEIRARTVPDAVVINESMLAQVLNVSRTPARRALHTLVDNGLVAPLPTRGFITGSEASTATSRLTDHPKCITSLRDALRTNLSPMPLLEDLERCVSRLSVHGAWRISIRAAQDYYSVGRGTLEEALRELEINGLVARRVGGQWIALKMDCERLEMLFDVRSWIEPKLLEQATVHIPMDVLDRAIADHEAALERLPNVTSQELDGLEVALHRDLMAYAQNGPGLTALRYVKAGLVLSKHVLASDEIPVGQEDPFIEEHLGILSALKRRRSEECKLRLLAHLLKSREKCASRLERYRAITDGSECEFAKRIDTQNPK